MVSWKVGAPVAGSGSTNIDKGEGEQPLRSRRSARRAALYRRICQTLGNHNKDQSGNRVRTNKLQQYHKVDFEDAKTWMERRLAGMKKGVPNWVATALADKWSRT